MRRVGKLSLYEYHGYIDIGFIRSDSVSNNNIFAIKKFAEGYILRIWGSQNAHWLDEYGVECMKLTHGSYGVIVKNGVDEI